MNTTTQNITVLPEESLDAVQGGNFIYTLVQFGVDFYVGAKEFFSLPETVKDKPGYIPFNFY